MPNTSVVLFILADYYFTKEYKPGLPITWKQLLLITLIAIDACFAWTI